MSHLPLAIIVFFLLTTLLALLLFGKAARGSKIVVVGSLLWMCVQSAVALSGFYLVTDTLPPHFFLVVAPPILIYCGLVLNFGLNFGRKTVPRWDGSEVVRASAFDSHPC
jgi:hypothetical protein